MDQSTFFTDVFWFWKDFCRFEENVVFIFAVVKKYNDYDEIIYELNGDYILFLKDHQVI